MGREAPRDWLGELMGVWEAERGDRCERRRRRWVPTGVCMDPFLGVGTLGGSGRGYAPFLNTEGPK